jgi:steroid delta-isomerase-like uncharacterized protein
MSEQNKATARRFFEEIASEGRLDAMEEVLAEDYQEHDPAADPPDARGREAFRDRVMAFRSGFDFQFTVEDQLAERDEVATRWTWQATHHGEMFGIQPTGKRVVMTGVTIFRFADGRIQEGWWHWDALGLLRQIGALPAQQAA